MQGIDGFRAQLAAVADYFETLHFSFFRSMLRFLRHASKR